ncbi:L-glutamate gamma-semialdehyde dehydrogenase [Angustibacter sp. Root456]|uniref:L-glutamate gamma-semialdehyde dehydrogenase n=1 Tax=Angustibacter sp. Root456 TaxID=1736539 RepID=UPI0006FBAC52|nr:L-glutamate gamma-semialdehyde dehydrogenase [Angustibacter sp. Root456]KQX61828.1 1-pyrroline-5-carboxylate dehydrogenase [Angustibacter sp. Root456]
MDAVTAPPQPVNEAVRTYAPGSPGAAALRRELDCLASGSHDVGPVIDGRVEHVSDERLTVTQPHERHTRLLTASVTSPDQAVRAIDSAVNAAAAWREAPFDTRAAVLLKAADLLCGPWRARINAATMLGQSKSVHQAEIDAACELADFWRFNVHFARQILAEQPLASSPGTWNTLDHRPLEGFVYAVTPFNFTAIAGNLPTAPALMGNAVVWKPATTQLLAADLTLQLLTEAGLPPGVINMLPGPGPEVSDVVLSDRRLAGIHFTGSTEVFRQLWKQVGTRLDTYSSYPRLVGETGGKDFVVAHPSADVDRLRTALVRGAFEYQGQKCSAASRAFIPASVWARLKDALVDDIRSIAMGDVRDFSTFMGAVIDQRAYRRLTEVLDRARHDPSIEVLAGGGYTDRVGWFVEPTLLVGTDPTHEVFRREFFGPILSVHVYDDGAYDDVLALVDSGSPYGLTGAVFARDRAAVDTARQALRFAAGNFYVNDKPTGAVVGQQPFGGGRASGTNDKAGSAENLRRWTSTRTIKETFVADTDYRYPHMAPAAAERTGGFAP